MVERRADVSGRKSCGTFFPGGKWWSSEDKKWGHVGLGWESRFWVGNAEGLVSSLFFFGERAGNSVFYIHVFGKYEL
jgi:hypothetical protein